MDTLLFLFGGAFVVGFSGAMMPGPVLTATISEVLKRGWTAGPLIVLGHAILEIMVLAAVVLGLGQWLQLDPVMATIGIVGGIALVFMGTQMAVTAKAAAEAAAHAEADPKTAIRGPVWTGAVTSVANPYFPLWWATIGLTYASYALRHGFAGLTAFYSGHILSDLAWYTVVAVTVASGRRLCPPTIHRWLIVLCGLILIGLGMFFFGDALGKVV